MVDLPSSTDFSNRGIILNIYFSIDTSGKCADAAFGITQRSVLMLVSVPLLLLGMIIWQ